jgi:hypothetical protein
LLDQRADLSAAQAIEHLVGMQSQIPTAPYVGLWSRLRSFTTDDLSTLMHNREAVRGTLMRVTLHLATARDYLAMRPVMQPHIERAFGRTPWRAELANPVRDELVQHVRALLDGSPSTRVELSRALAERWPDGNAESMAHAGIYLVPMIQSTPRGVWGSSAAPRFITVESWLGRELDTNTAPDQMLLRYLRAFGPATIADMRAWSYLTGLRAVVERLKPRLRMFRDERGRELFDVSEAPIADEDAPAPVRFLPEFDNALYSHDDRTRIIAAQQRAWLNRQRFGGCMVLVDGFARGGWRHVRSKSSSLLRIEPLDAWSPAERTAVEEEAQHLARFLGADSVELIANER